MLLAVSDTESNPNLVPSSLIKDDKGEDTVAKIEFGDARGDFRA